MIRKKVLATAGALTLMLAIICAGFVNLYNVYGDEAGDHSQLEFKKEYKLLNNQNGSKAPADTFVFKITPQDGAPAFDNANPNVQLSGAGKESIHVNWPNFTSPGIYKYTITEKEDSTMGTYYSGETLELTVYVTNKPDGTGGFNRTYTLKNKTGGDKTDGFINTYKAGELDITKTVTGLFGDMKKEFTVKVTFKKPDDKKLGGNIVFGEKVIKPEDFNGGKATVEVKIKNGEHISFQNVPYGMEYTLTEVEANQDGYVTTYENENGTMSQDKVAAAITNSKGGNIPTGIIHSVAKYGIAFAALIMLSAIVVIRRRKKNA